MSKTASEMMDIILAEVLVELRERGTGSGLCAKAIYPGNAIPADYGIDDCGGMAWVQLQSASPSATFPQPLADLNSCTYSLAYTIDVGIMRPVKVPEAVGRSISFPTDEENRAAAVSQLDDMEAMHVAINRARADIDLMVLNQYTPEGPEGGVVSGVWTMQVGNEDPD